MNEKTVKATGGWGDWLFCNATMKDTTLYIHSTSRASCYEGTSLYHILWTLLLCPLVHFGKKGIKGVIGEMWRAVRRLPRKYSSNKCRVSNLTAARKSNNVLYFLKIRQTDVVEVNYRTSLSRERSPKVLLTS